MSCYSLKLENGSAAIICGRGLRAERCRWCTHTGTFQCDWKISKGRTCDKHLCAAHAKEVAPNKHLCPEHQKSYEQWLAARAGKEPAKTETNPSAPANAMTDERRAVARQHTQVLKEKLRGTP